MTHTEKVHVIFGLAAADIEERQMDWDREQDTTVSQ